MNMLKIKIIDTDTKLFHKTASKREIKRFDKRYSKEQGILERSK